MASTVNVELEQVYMVLKQVVGLSVTEMFSQQCTTVEQLGTSNA